MQTQIGYTDYVADKISTEETKSEYPMAQHSCEEKYG